MIEFVLTENQMALACLVGCQRQRENILKHRRPEYNAGNAFDWQYHIEGAMGEFCLAKYLNLFWDGKLGDLSAGDIGPVEARTTGALAKNTALSVIHQRGMLLHKKDKDDRPFVCLTGINGTYRIHGWLPGREGKLKAYWGDPYKTGRPAFWVPQTALRPMAKLKELLNIGVY